MGADPFRHQPARPTLSQTRNPSQHTAMHLLALLAVARRGLAAHHQHVIDQLLLHDGVNVALAYAKRATRPRQMVNQSDSR